MFLKYLNLKYFLISFAIGILYIYLTNDYKKVFVLYPNPNHVDKYTFAEKSNFFSYRRTTKLKHKEYGRSKKTVR